MHKMRTMVSMELADEDKIDACLPMPCEKPDYPYGLRISLSEKELEKLQLDCEEAVAGGIFHGHFMARITSVSKEERDGKKTCRIEAQIEDLAIESEDMENEEQDREEGRPRKPRSVLYG
jgi:hypothetical protein